MSNEQENKKIVIKEKQDPKPQTKTYSNPDKSDRSNKEAKGNEKPTDSTGPRKR